MKAILKKILLINILLGLVACGGGSSSNNLDLAPDPAQNVPPISNAGTNQNIVTGTVVTLNGSLSTDANGDLLSYEWFLTTIPSGSVAVLSSPTTVSPVFTADVDGIYIAQLTVNDGTETSTIDTVTIVASSGNSIPVADAGTDQNIVTGQLIHMDGSSSSDANGDTLTYEWSWTSVPSGSSVTLSNSTSVSPSFIANIVGSYVVQLTVSDGTETSAIDTVRIVAVAPTGNSAPVANAGADQNIVTATVTTLDGSLSVDANGDSLSYAWSLISVPSESITASLSSNSGVTPTFIADVDGSYVIQLTVNDGIEASAVDTVTITAATANSIPIANAGIDQNIVTGALVLLDGSLSSDANGDTLSYAWSLISVPSGSITASLSSPIGVSPTFIADVDGSYVVQLTVNDGIEASAVDVVTITATTTNSAPIANAGIDQNILIGALVLLDGTASSDADGDTLTYAWTLISVPSGSITASLSSTVGVSPTIIPDVDGSYVIQLTVNDGIETSAVDTVTITAVLGI